VVLEAAHEAGDILLRRYERGTEIWEVAGVTLWAAPGGGTFRDGERTRSS